MQTINDFTQYMGKYEYMNKSKTPGKSYIL